MFDLLSIGTVGIDLYFQGDSLTHNRERFELAIGGKYFVDHFYEGLGGGGANVAIGVRNHGLKVALMAKIGENPFKKILLNKLKEAKVRHGDFCQIEKDYFNISTIFLTEKGEKTIVNYRTPHQHLMNEEADFQKIKKAQALYLANLPNVSLTEREKILTFAKKNSVTTYVNLGVVDCRRPKQQLMEFIKHIDVLILNGHEFADLVKAPYGDIDFSEDVVSHYVSFLRQHTVIVTEGEKGSFGYKDGKVYHQKTLPVEKIIDTTGAGDGFTAGFISVFSRKKNIAEGLLSGAKYAVKILGKIGAN